MSKKTLPHESEMTDATAFETDPDKLVDEARGYALGLWRHVHRGLGDTQENAMHEAARLAKVTPNTIWKLRYRRPREIGASIYFKLKAAHARHVQSVEARVADNLAALRSLPATPANRRLVASMEEFLGHSEGEAGFAEPYPEENADQSTGWGR